MPGTEKTSVDAATERRSKWVELLERMARPVLEAASRDELRASMPIRCQASDRKERKLASPMEALCRLLQGMAPWFELNGLAADENQRRQAMLDLAKKALYIAFDSKNKDYLDFTISRNGMIEASMLALAFLRAPKSLWASLPPEKQDNALHLMRTIRKEKPLFNNWILFPALIEAFFAECGEDYDIMRIQFALRQHEQWYYGDGYYGDGPHFHQDYYNSIIIHPYLLRIVEITAKVDAQWQPLVKAIKIRAQRLAVLLERMIAPDGSFAPLGRSLAYRAGCFHLLSEIALREDLPEPLMPGAARCALDAVIERTLAGTKNYDEQGWLLPGVCADQLTLVEPYLSTGSLYLASSAFLPLGLSASLPFWSEADQPWTSCRLWSGESVEADRSLEPNRDELDG